jgi:hypothetical protein
MLSISRIYCIDDRMVNEFGAVGGTRIDGGNSGTWRKPSSILLCPSQIPHHLARAALAGSTVFTLMTETAAFSQTFITPCSHKLYLCINF